MFRRFVTYAILFFFCWAQNAMAIAGNGRFASSNEFLKDSGITKREVSLKELQQKYGQFLPQPIRVQMERLIQENPNLKLPKMDVNKIQVNGQPQLEFNINLPEGSFVLTTVNSNRVVFNLVGNINGQPIHQEITHEMILRAHEIIYEQRKALAKQKPIFLSAETILKLPAKEQISYIKKMRALLEAAEAVQKSDVRRSEPAKKSVLNYFFEKAVEGQAFGDAGPNSAGSDPVGNSSSSNYGGPSCIVAGYIDGIWDPNATSVTGGAGVCNPSALHKQNDGSCSSGSTSCNPLLYGDFSCVPFSTAADKSNATKNCGSLASGDPDCKKVVSNFKNVNDKNSPQSLSQLRAFLKDMKAEVNQKIGDCESFPHTQSSQDQKNTCQVLKDRLNVINSLDCTKDVIKNDPDFSAACQSLQPQPTPAGPVNPDTGDDPMCSTLKSSGCTVTHATSSTVHCADGDKTYCSGCESGYTPVQGADVIVLQCTKDGSSHDIKSSISNGLSSVGNFFSTHATLLLGIAGLAGLFGTMFYMQYSQNQTYKAEQRQYQQEFAASVSTGTSPIPTLTQPIPGVSLKPDLYHEMLYPGSR